MALTDVTVATTNQLLTYPSAIYAGVGKHLQKQVGGAKELQLRQQHFEKNPELTPESLSNNEDSAGSPRRQGEAEHMLGSSMIDTINKIPKAYMASAEQDYFRDDDKNGDTDRKVISAFSDMVASHQPMTCKKPNNGQKNVDSLQKSATTRANTGHHCTPLQKHQSFDAIENNYSDKFTPEVAKKRS